MTWGQGVGVALPLLGAAVAAGLAGLGDGTPTTPWALAQGMLSGVVVGVLFLAVAWLTDARDLRPLLDVQGRTRTPTRRRGTSVSASVTRGSS